MKEKFFWVISYDIRDDKRRNKTAKELKNYGKRIQFSVFECLLGEDQLNKLFSKLKKITNSEQDRVRIYKLCEGCQKNILLHGKGEITKDEDVYII